MSSRLMVRPRVFLDFSVGGVPVGRVVFELFTQTAPKTCENFRALCTGEKGLSPLSERPLYYKNTIVHRSIKDFMIQAGDFTKRNGSGGESIYGSPFPDEDLDRPLDAEGLLCMANRGPNTNQSQFFITLRACSHLDGKHVVFGKVIRGYEEVVKKLADVPVDDKDRPTIPMVISNCGELELRSSRPSDFNRKKRSPSVSDSESKAEHHPRPHTPDPDSPRRHRKRAKHKKKVSERDEGSEKEQSDGVIAETEEEYDARLEREEAERLEAERKRELERIKKRYEDATHNKDGVRFKGRGRMKFVDPEVTQRRQV